MTASSDDTGAADASALKIGVATLHLGDRRALGVTVRSLQRLPDAFERLVVVEHPSGLRPLTRVDEVGADDWIAYNPAINPRTAALRALEGCDVAVMIREGVALGPGAIAAERQRFADNSELRAVMLTSRRELDLDKFLGFEDQTDPYRTLTERGKFRGWLAPVYFMPCLLAVALGRGPTSVFENFTRRSEWATSRLYLDAFKSRSAFVEASSTAFGLISNDPDRRDSALQGRKALEELARFGTAYPAYGRTAKADMRRLIWQHVSGVARGSRPRARLRFLGGVVEGLRLERGSRRRVAQDISDLA